MQLKAMLDDCCTVPDVKLIQIKYTGKHSDQRVFNCYMDEADFEKIRKYKWSVLYSVNNKSFYARADEYSDGKKRTVLMHRLITGCADGLVVDHINHNTLDNRRENLRCVHRRVNNSNLKRKTSSDYLGVSFNKRSGKWRAAINRVYLGLFEKETDARDAVNDYLKGVIHG